MVCKAQGQPVTGYSARLWHPPSCWLPGGLPTHAPTRVKMAHSLGLDLTRPVRAAIPLCQARCVSQGPARRQTHALKGPGAPRDRVVVMGRCCEKASDWAVGPSCAWRCHAVPDSRQPPCPVPGNPGPFCVASMFLKHLGEPPGETSANRFYPCSSLIAGRFESIGRFKLQSVVG